MSSQTLNRVLPGPAIAVLLLTLAPVLPVLGIVMTTIILRLTVLK